MPPIKLLLAESMIKSAGMTCFTMGLQDLIKSKINLTVEAPALLQLPTSNNTDTLDYSAKDHIDMLMASLQDAHDRLPSARRGGSTNEIVVINKQTIIRQYIAQLASLRAGWSEITDPT